MARFAGRSLGEVRGPDIVVIGAMRCATTSLYEILRAHPDFEVTKVKECDFFLPNEFEEGIEAFKKLITRSDLPIVDVSPNYSKLYQWPGTAKRIFKTNPDAKLIYIVRDPIARSISAYNALYLSGHHLPKPEQVVPNCTENEVLSGSMYATHLKAFLKYWDPSNITIVDYDKLVSNPEEAVEEMMNSAGFKCDRKGIQSIRTNDSIGLRRRPKSWAHLRNTGFGRRARRMLPQPMLERVKSMVFSVTPNQAPPPTFSSSARTKIGAYLKSDTNEFRELTGRTFDHWSI